MKALLLALMMMVTLISCTNPTQVETREIQYVIDGEPCMVDVYYTQYGEEQREEVFSVWTKTVECEVGEEIMFYVITPACVSKKVTAIIFKDGKAIRRVTNDTHKDIKIWLTVK